MQAHKWHFSFFVKCLLEMKSAVRVLWSMRAYPVHVWRDHSRSALEGAAKENGNDELHDSDDDLIESSEEEDDDELEERPQRMPEPRRFKAQPTVGPGNQSNSTCDVSPGPPTWNGDREGGYGSDSHVQTRVGPRPSVAFQMQEMEGRPCDDDPIASPECSDAHGQDDSCEESKDSRSTDNFVREYMVRFQPPGGRETTGCAFFVVDCQQLGVEAKTPRTNVFLKYFCLSFRRRLLPDVDAGHQHSAVIRTMVCLFFLHTW